MYCESVVVFFKMGGAVQSYPADFHKFLPQIVSRILSCASFSFELTGCHDDVIAAHFLDAFSKTEGISISRSVRRSVGRSVTFERFPL